MKIVGFGIVSIIGLGLDFAVFSLLGLILLPTSVANMISATCGVTFVYFAAVKAVFRYDGHFLLGKFALYLVYQALAILIASLLIGALAGWLGHWAVLSLTVGLVADRALDYDLLPLLAKCAITPLTFYTNFLFMNWLLYRKLRWR